MAGECILEMRGISKRFGGTYVLDKVNFSLRHGEVHSLIGANGAGKSTLVKILNGIYAADGGEIVINGQPVLIHQSGDAGRYGISFVHQELNVCPDLSVAENIMVGRLECGRFGFYDAKKTRERARRLIDLVQVELDVDVPVRSLRAAEKQIIEILKALTVNAKIMVLDEPTSSLNEREKKVFFDIVGKLKRQGVSIIFISHFLEDVLLISDRITVLKDGANNGVFQAGAVDKDALISAMMGKTIRRREDGARRLSGTAAVILELENLCGGNRFRGIDMKVRRGDILGVCGLLGAGKTELARAVFGLDPFDSGTIRMHGERLRSITPGSMMRRGVAFLSEDRKAEGFAPLLSIRENATLSMFHSLSNFLGVMNRRRQNGLAGDLAARMAVKCSSIEQAVASLSGGNQQKVIIARCVASVPRLFILDEPTRGVDVFAKSEIYGILAGMAADGVSILIFSSELEELLEICDEIVALKKGEIVKRVDASEVDKNALMHMIS
ncbi:MAG: sugar ABC transporter ATP-binding protein [Planctomycetota bacterium]|jgi:ABC-type sugar transport system ATPase subunit|nr:sugar ABC transporter ATP-binding protein [Planctomycetota bacterium]